MAFLLEWSTLLDSVGIQQALPLSALGFLSPLSLIGNENENILWGC